MMRANPHTGSSTEESSQIPRDLISHESTSHDRTETVDSTEGEVIDKLLDNNAKKSSWLASTFLSVDLDNVGSVARDHLANERTYLAWLRTSLSLASIGIAVTQLFRLTNATPPSTLPAASQLVFQQLLVAISDPPTKQEIQNLLLQLDSPSSNTPTGGKYRYLAQPIGATFIGMALLFLALGTLRYWKVQNLLMEEPSAFSPSRKSIAISSATVGTLVVVSFSVILATR